MNQLSFTDLQEAVRKGAALRCRIKLQPDGGDGAKVFPPTYAGGVYAVENRRIEGRVVRCVLLDSVQSQANRMEEALLEAFLPNWRELPTDVASCDLPVIAVNVGTHGWITSLTAPHRIHDAILRDSNLDGTRFRDSNVGQAVVNARLWNATAFYRYCPTALLFGTWDSTAGEGLDSAKVPRAVVSEIIGVDMTPGVRTGSRIDPLGIARESATIYRRADNPNDWTLVENQAARNQQGTALRFGKGPKAGKPAAINHGNIPPDLARFGDRSEVRKQHLELLADILQEEPVEFQYKVRSSNGEMQSHTAFKRTLIDAHAVKPGGVTLPYALHTWTTSLTQLRRLRFPASERTAQRETGNGVDRHQSARAVLAALALYALALLRERGYWLRSRCELIPQTDGDGCPASLELIRSDGRPDSFVIPDTAAAKGLLKQACEEARRAFGANSEEARPTHEGTESPSLPNPGWEQRVIRLTPTQQLVDLVRASDSRSPEQDGPQQETPSAGNQS